MSVAFASLARSGASHAASIANAFSRSAIARVRIYDYCIAHAHMTKIVCDC